MSIEVTTADRLLPRCANCAYFRRLPPSRAGDGFGYCEDPGKTIYGPMGTRRDPPRTVRTAWCHGFLERPRPPLPDRLLLHGSTNPPPNGAEAPKDLPRNVVNFGEAREKKPGKRPCF